MCEYTLFFRIKSLKYGKTAFFNAPLSIPTAKGRYEHGRIVLNSEEDWDEFKDQLLMFPANGVHDDLPDSLSYIDQLAVTSYFEEDDSDEWQPLDVISGI